MMPHLIYSSNALDFQQQKNFLNGYHLRFKHLDWVNELDRLNAPFAFTLVKNEQIGAMISCATENSQTAWIRYFVSDRGGNHADYFQALLETATIALKKANVPNLYALGSPEWFGRLLQANGFSEFTRIITLSLDVDEPPVIEAASHVQIRAMTSADLDTVYSIDQQAFEPIWQLAAQNLRNCFDSSSYKTVALIDDKIVAYLLSESVFFSHHLSRIAVDTKQQGMGLSKHLLTELIQSQYARGTHHFTVNTHDSNLNALKLYEHFGFKKLDDAIPVYALNL